jgi:hypothetical protein
MGFDQAGQARFPQRFAGLVFVNAKGSINRAVESHPPAVSSGPLKTGARCRSVHTTWRVVMLMACTRVSASPHWPRHTDDLTRPHISNGLVQSSEQRLPGTQLVIGNTSQDHSHRKPFDSVLVHQSTVDGDEHIEVPLSIGE